MEILLAIVVASAVIFFGALTSIGNERQRKAIDNLREQVTLWATQDLRIKRESLSQNVRVHDPLGWFNRIATRIFGFNHDIQLVEFFDQPKSIVFIDNIHKSKLIFSPLSPNEINRLTKEKRSKLSGFSTQSPLFSLARRVKTYNYSVLNSGILFDLELSFAWKEITGDELVAQDSLWVYIPSQ